MKDKTKYNFSNTFKRQILCEKLCCGITALNEEITVFFKERMVSSMETFVSNKGRIDIGDFYGNGFSFVFTYFHSYDRTLILGEKFTPWIGTYIKNNGIPNVMENLKLFFYNHNLKQITKNDFEIKVLEFLKQYEDFIEFPIRKIV